MMRRFIDTVLARRMWILAATALISLASVLVLPRAQLSTELGRLFLGEDPAYDEYLDLSSRFGSDAQVVVGLDCPEPLSAAQLERLRAAIAEASQVDGVLGTTSLLDAVRLRRGLLPGIPAVERYAQLAAADPARAPELTRELTTHPLYGGRLISRDGGALTITVDIRPSDAEQLVRRIAGIRAPFEARWGPERVHLTGLPTYIQAVLTEVKRALSITTPAVAIVLLSVVWLMFGRLWPAAVSLAVAAVAVLWSLALGILIEPRVSVLIAMVPGMILILAFCDIVHLCSAYLIELEDGKPKDEAIRSACAEVGRACLFTSLTTFVGFLGLAMVPVPAFRLMGLLLSFGVAVALLLAVTLVPILFSLMPAPPALRRTAEGGSRGASGAAQRLVDGLLSGCLWVSFRRPWLVVLLFAALGAGSLYAASLIRVEVDFSRRLSSEHPVNRDGDWFRERFRSARMLQVIIRAEGRERDPAWLAELARLQGEIETLPGVEGSLSIVDLVAEVERLRPGTEGQRRPLPGEAAALRPLLQLITASGRARPLYDAEAGTLRMIVPISGHGVREASAAGREVSKLAVSRLGEARVEVTGFHVLIGRFLDMIVVALFQGMLNSSIMIAILMAIGLRSLRVGVLSMAPNLLPLIVIGGAMGLAWRVVDSDAFILAFVALGVGVDDTIHVLVRYRAERASADRETAMRRTFCFAGRGVVITTAILGIGTLPFLISDFFLMRMLGSQLPLCLLIALLADILLVPAMTTLGWLDFSRRSFVDEVLSEMARPEPSRRYEAAIILHLDAKERDAVDRDRRWVAPLIDMLADEDLHCRGYAAEAIGKLQLTEALPALRDAEAREREIGESWALRYLEEAIQTLEKALGR